MGMPAAVPVARDAALPLTVRNDEDTLTRATIALASEHGRYGYRRISSLLREGGMESWQGPGAADPAAAIL